MLSWPSQLVTSAVPHPKGANLNLSLHKTSTGPTVNTNSSANNTMLLQWGKLQEWSIRMPFPLHVILWLYWFCSAIWKLQWATSWTLAITQKASPCSFRRNIRRFHQTSLVANSLQHGFLQNTTIGGSEWTLVHSHFSSVNLHNVYLRISWTYFIQSTHGER